MKILINAPSVEVPAVFEEFIEKRVQEVLTPFESQLTRIEIHLQDQNAGKGGPDKRCVLEARPRGLDPIVVETIAEDEAGAVRKSLDKLKHALERRFGKRAVH